MDLSNLPQVHLALQEMEKKCYDKNQTLTTQDAEYVQIIWIRWCVAKRANESLIQSMQKKVSRYSPAKAYQILTNDGCDKCFQQGEFINWKEPGLFCGECAPLDDTEFLKSVQECVTETLHPPLRSISY
jgi:hypothetical protein